MERMRAMMRWAAMICMLLALVIFAISAEGVRTPVKDSPEGRVDTILIDTSALSGRLDKPPVPFPHDLHTDALAKQKKDCFSCHLKEARPLSASAPAAPGVQPGERMSIKFKRFKDTIPREVRGIYHENCIGCHMSLAEKGKKFGPIVCGECHKGAVDHSASKPMGMDLSLHFWHSKAAKEKCETCHHEYDEKAKKLFYAKGEEGTCRYCHKEKTEENRISMPLASHLSCVECHREGQEKNVKSGPVTCGGCHDEKSQMKIQKVEPLPRLERNQPDAVFVKTLGQDEKGTITRMNPVPFDHKAHEGYNDTCRVCHHEEMAACNSCHTLAKPAKKGGNVQLERSMHQSGSPMSCVGCHEMNQKAKECAGCHGLMPRGAQSEDEVCLKCHMKPLTQTTTPPPSQAAEKEGAERLLQSRQTVKGTYPVDEIPDHVQIKTLVDKYEQVELPHRRIVLSLMKGMNGSKGGGKLASYFHNDQSTVCQGCHHRSPASPKPPACLTCHSRPFDEGNLAKPGIIGAYHQQCMGCHEAMGIEHPKVCADCHKERKK
jgi:Class III cytochrome C family